MQPTQPTNELQFDARALKQASLPIRALRHKLRLQILYVIHKKGRINVTDIYKKLKIDQPLASAHLALLRNAEIVTTERVASFVFYSINYKRLKAVEAFAGQLLKIENQSCDLDY
jgi:DNA-binding transcriptional ArsR family regulator